MAYVCRMAYVLCRMSYVVWRTSYVIRRTSIGNCVICKSVIRDLTNSSIRLYTYVFVGGAHLQGAVRSQQYKSYHKGV
jgi:hypothetical protein